MVAIWFGQPFWTLPLPLPLPLWPPLSLRFCGELTIHQFESLLNARQAEDDKELDAAATECCRMKRVKPTLARLPHPAASSTTTSAPLVPAPLGNTPPPSLEGMCAAWAIPSRNCGKSAGSAINCGRWQREFESPGNTIFA